MMRMYLSIILRPWNLDLQGSKLRVIEGSQGMTLDKVAGLEDVDAGQGKESKHLYDPHTWLDPVKIAEEGKVIAQRLGEIDPKNKELYQANAQKLEKRCEDLSPEQEPTARQLAEIQQFVKDYKVKTIFVEKHTSSKVADSIAKATGARVKVLDPLEADPQNDKDLLENLEENMATLAKELEE